MDDIPDVTQRSIASAEDFTYEFLVPTAGSYMYHSHVGLQFFTQLTTPYGAINHRRVPSTSVTGVERALALSSFATLVITACD